MTSGGNWPNLSNIPQAAVPAAAPGEAAEAAAAGAVPAAAGEEAARPPPRPRVQGREQGPLQAEVRGGQDRPQRRQRQVTIRAAMNHSEV